MLNFEMKWVQMFTTTCSAESQQETTHTIKFFAGSLYLTLHQHFPTYEMTHTMSWALELCGARTVCRVRRHQMMEHNVSDIWCAHGNTVLGISGSKASKGEQYKSASNTQTLVKCRTTLSKRRHQLAARTTRNASTHLHGKKLRQSTITDVFLTRKIMCTCAEVRWRRKNTSMPGMKFLLSMVPSEHEQPFLQRTTRDEWFRPQLFVFLGHSSTHTLGLWVLLVLTRLIPSRMLTVAHAQTGQVRRSHHSCRRWISSCV